MLATEIIFGVTNKFQISSFPTRNMPLVIVDLNLRGCVACSVPYRVVAYSNFTKADPISVHLFNYKDRCTCVRNTIYVGTLHRIMHTTFESTS